MLMLDTVFAVLGQQFTVAGQVDGKSNWLFIEVWLSVSVPPGWSIKFVYNSCYTAPSKKIRVADTYSNSAASDVIFHYLCMLRNVFTNTYTVLISIFCIEQ